MMFLDGKPLLIFTNALGYEFWRVTNNGTPFAEQVSPKSEEIFIPSEKSISKYLASCIVRYLPLSVYNSADNFALAINTNIGCWQEATEFLRVMYDKGFHYASPMRFPHTVNSSILGVAARSFGIENEAVLLIGENSLSFGMDVLRATPSLEGCVCISIDALERANGIGQYCSLVTLTRRAASSWRPFVSMTGRLISTPAALHSLVETASEQFDESAVLVYASDRSKDDAMSELSGLQSTFADIFVCRLGATENSGGFILFFLMCLTDQLAPTRPIIIIHRNHLSMIEVASFGPRNRETLAN